MPVVSYRYCPRCDSAFGGSRCSVCGDSGVSVSMRPRRKVPVVVVLAAVSLLMAGAAVYFLYGGGDDWGAQTCCLYCGVSVVFVMALIYLGWKMMAYRFRSDMEAVLEAGRRQASAMGRPPRMGGEKVQGPQGGKSRRPAKERAGGPPEEEVVETEGREFSECPRCGGSVPVESSACPDCGLARKKKRKKKKRVE